MRSSFLASVDVIELHTDEAGSSLGAYSTMIMLMMMMTTIMMMMMIIIIIIMLYRNVV
jgi:hypothetical protein